MRCFCRLLFSDLRDHATSVSGVTYAHTTVWDVSGCCLHFLRLYFFLLVPGMAWGAVIPSAPGRQGLPGASVVVVSVVPRFYDCLLYTSDAADE